MYRLLVFGKHPYYLNGDKVDNLKERIKSMHSDVQNNLTKLQFSLFSRLTMTDAL